MSLQDKLKEIDDELAEGADAPVEEESEQEEPAADEGADQEAAPEGEEEGAEEPAPVKKPDAKAPPKTDEKTGTKEPKTPPAQADKTSNEAMARLRMEAAASKRRAQELEAILRRGQQQPQAHQPAPTAKENPDPEPDKEIDPDAHLRWELRQANSRIEKFEKWQGEQEKRVQSEETDRQATQTLVDYEEDFKTRAAAEGIDDYEPVSRFVMQTITNSVRLLRPDLRGEALTKAVKSQLFRLAAEHERNGYNPMEAMYHTAKTQWGYQAPAPKEDGGDEQPADRKPNGQFVKQKPDFKKIVESKRRNATAMTAGARNGHAALTKEHAMSKNFKVSDWAKLSPEQLRDLEGQEA